jgi:hypothetical protein
MTTSNKIVMAVKENVLSIPLDCIHNQDSITYVYRKQGASVLRQEVKVGLKNDNEAEILEGLRPEDELYLSIPPDGESLKLEPSTDRKR